MLTDNIGRFYKEDREGLSIAEAAIKELQKLEGNCDVPTGTGEMDWRGRNGGIRSLGIGISTEFIRKGFIDLRGKEVSSPGQLAVLTQVYRDPRFETLRFIYVKDNLIVGHEGITSKLPAASVAFLDLPDKADCKNEYEFSRKVKTAQTRFFMDISNRMRRLDADGYFLLHNHPSAIDVRPSQEDINTTAMYQKALSGFRGHVIIDSNQYSFIDENFWVSVNQMYLGKDKMLEPALPHPLLGENINSSEKLARIAKTMQMEPDYSVVIYMSTKNFIRAIQEVPDGLFKKEKECVDFLRGRMYEFGASRAFVITNSQRVREMASSMVEKGYLLDAIVTNRDYTVTSVRESGISPNGLPDVCWMGRNTNRGVKVSERNHNHYSTLHDSRVKALKTDKDKPSVPTMDR